MSKKTELLNLVAALDNELSMVATVQGMIRQQELMTKISWLEGDIMEMEAASSDSIDPYECGLTDMDEFVF